MNAPATIEQDTRLDELAQFINAGHEEIRKVGRAALERAVEIGHAILEAQAQVPKGEWLRWMRRNVDFHPTTAYKYVRLARLAQANKLPEGATGVEHALRLAAEEPWHNRTLLSDDEKARMAELVKTEGLHAVAEAFGVVPSTVWRWTSPNSPIASRGQRSGHRTDGRVGITDEMIEVVAEWLVKRFADAGYFAKVNDQVRHDALDLLGLVVRAI
jgi:hypothetical protein